MIDKVIIYRYFYLLLDIQPLHIDLIKEARNFLSSGLHFCVQILFNNDDSHSELII